MRIDFSTIKEFRVPEGVVTQIADASGRVIWSAVKNVTVTIVPYANSTVTWSVTINGVTYDRSLSGEVEIIVPEGTLVYCSIMPTSAVSANIKLGSVYGTGDIVATSAKGSGIAATYTHIVTGDTKISHVASFGAAYIGIEE